MLSKVSVFTFKILSIKLQRKILVKTEKENEKNRLRNEAQNQKGRGISKEVTHLTGPINSVPGCQSSFGNPSKTGWYISGINVNSALSPPDSVKEYALIHLIMYYGNVKEICCMKEKDLL